ncbi:DMT family transporter [Lactiplantibacillus garii]|uniref:DMT family transporter n=1 Tax=Lactiplantibacillus garii TaxID=2306423 RepID=A0A3R8KZ40_9LACO|nr:DMT family transporter [Lactiplantibacillus garii]RRK09327.1 DMT family transporter [Lactiplantibacillus garii]
MVILALIPLLIGSGLAVQTAVNSQLRRYVQSPYLASAVSFAIGTVFLTLLTVGTGTSLAIRWSVVVNNPWWIWLGGLLGVVGLTVNLLLFPRLGSIQTAVLPIFGQIVMGVLIDQFGWLNSPRLPLTGVKVGGLLLVTAGMFVATGVLKRRSDPSRGTRPQQWPWRVLGIVAGSMVAAQAAINGHLGAILNSPIHAATVSFTIGTALLVLLVCGRHIPLRPLMAAVRAGRQRWWIWLGGLLGAAYVFGSAWLVPRIGTGQVVVIALFGQLFFSAVIEQFGWLGAPAERVGWGRLSGLLIMFVGVIGVHFF